MKALPILLLLLAACPQPSQKQVRIEVKQVTIPVRNCIVDHIDMCPDQ